MSTIKIICISFIVFSTFSCKKEEGTSIDYSTFRIKQAIHHLDGTIDTTIYTYSGDNVETRTVYSTSPSTVYIRNFTKSGSQYQVDFYTNATHSHSGFYNINSAGFLDTSRLTNLSSMLFNNRDKYYYDADGRNTRSISNYNTYENDSKRYYNSNDDYMYWIYDVYRFDNPLLSRKDSVVFEYYLDKPLHVPFKAALESTLGKPNKHLIKKRLYYDLLNSNVLRQTYEYDYLTDENGLVTREIWRIYTQPGNVLTRTDTTFFTYYED